MVTFYGVLLNFIGVWAIGLKLLWVISTGVLMFVHRIYEGADAEIKKAFCKEHHQNAEGNMQEEKKTR